MGTMNNLRERTGVILWILVISFGVIWVLQDSGALDVVGTGAGQNVIVVDGAPVTYEEYAGAVNQQMDQYQQRTGESMPPQMLDQVRESVFQALVEDKLREREMNRLGIEVTDEEVYDMVMGENPHPIITVYFGDGQGGVNRALLQNFANNPEARADWLQIENYLRSERRREKLDKLIQATVRVTEQDVLEEHRQRNRSVDARWVGLRYSDVPDSEIQVTDRDLKAFYDANKQDFRRKRTYTVQYVTLSKRPTPEDTTRVADELARIRPNFAAAGDDSLFLARNASERPYSSAWFRADDLDQELATAVFSGDPQPGTVVGPVFAGGMGHLAKIVDVRPVDDVAVRASHILFRSPEEDEAVRQRALDVKRQIEQGADFAALAREHSDDSGTAPRGGELGWFGTGDMVLPFQEAAFDAPVGRVTGPIKTDFGYHLILVHARADEEVRLADYALTVRTDLGTINAMREKLEDLRYFAEETDASFQAEAQRLGLNVQNVQIEAEQDVIPGLGVSARMMDFLEDAERGDVSEVIELNNDFVVAHVDQIAPEGYRPFEEVRAEIEPQVKKQKKLAIQRARMEEAVAANDFQGLAGALGVPVRTAQDVTYNTQVLPLLGREPKFTGTVLGLDEGEVSGIVEGENAVFVVEATSVKDPGELTQSERQQIRNRLLTQRRNQVRTQWLAELREDAEVEDYRRLFNQ